MAALGDKKEYGRMQATHEHERRPTCPALTRPREGAPEGVDDPGKEVPDTHW